MDYALPATIDRSRWLRLTARIVSDVLSPAVLSIPCLAIGVWASGVPGTYRYALLYFAVAIPVPLVYMLWLLKTGRVTDIHLPNRHDRVGPFAVASASAAAGVALLFYLGAPAPSGTARGGARADAAVVRHHIGLADQHPLGHERRLATFAILAIGGAAVLLSLIVPLVMWARLYLRRHTLAQTLAGAALGCGAFGGLFLLHGIVW